METMLSVLYYTSIMDSTTTNESSAPVETTPVRVYWTHLHNHYTHLQQLLVDIGLVKVDVHRVPGGHHVIVVDHLNKSN